MRWLAGWVPSGGIIRNGGDPAWLKPLTGQGWQLIPSRSRPSGWRLQLYQEGHGATRIDESWRPAGLHDLSQAQAADLPPGQPAGLIGESVSWKSTAPPTACPATTLPSSAAKSGTSSRRSRKTATAAKDQSDILASSSPWAGGLRVLRSRAARWWARTTPTSASPSDQDGKIRDSYRRLRCQQNFHGEGCQVAGSSSVAPDRAGP